ncbi:GDYXXLXY domain-containing protein [Nocardioides sp. Soil805]|uniref:GDYXXLXY domain-containing protein n=1 Tax=Nocardioides sp. Soil805 TaxID=1736416 RepID=UPI0007030A14|nr:GDYXXLXY domain-containing protein [Nocardioides sp. Soil805]KRF35134.1 hypothetical protein ASG94_13510 [Nocardioides sp. Soil805]
MNRVLTVGLVATAQAVLVAVAVAPQISARTTGEDYTFRVEAVDPIDPFRGAYVTLAYPDLRLGGSSAVESIDGTNGGVMDDGRRGPVYVTLAEEDGHSVAQDWLRERPDSGPYLACDDSGWQVRCGIESWFLPQDEAAEMQDVLRDGALAEVRIDSLGHAALMDVRAD